MQCGLCTINAEEQHAFCTAFPKFNPQSTDVYQYFDVHLDIRSAYQKKVNGHKASYKINVTSEYKSMISGMGEGRGRIHESTLFNIYFIILIW